MSEKRFVIDEKTNYKDYPIILDTKTGDWWVIQDTMMGTEKLLDLLNEQQATIQQLKAKLKEKEEDERLYANEILELRKTNEEWLQFKDLGGDY